MLMFICSIYVTGNSIALHVQSNHSLQTVCWLDHCQFVAFTFSQCSPQYVCSNTSGEHFSMTHKDVSVLICSNLNSIKTIPQCFSVILQWSRTYGELDKQVYSMDVALRRLQSFFCCAPWSVYVEKDSSMNHADSMPLTEFGAWKIEAEEQCALTRRHVRAQHNEV